jgi:hypothetical protein
MDEKRVKIAENNFKNYLRDGLIKKEAFQNIIYQTYLKNAAEKAKCL